MSEFVMLVIGIGLIWLTLMAVMISRYKLPTIAEAIIVYGKIDPKDIDKFKIHTKGGVFIWPVIQKFYKLQLDEYKFSGKFNAKDTAGREITVTIDTQCKPDLNKLDVLVHENFLKSKAEIQKKIAEQIVFLVKHKMPELHMSDEVKRMNKRIFREVITDINSLLIQQGFNKSNPTNIFWNHTDKKEA